jgi:hypothetical protein
MWLCFERVCHLPWHAAYEMHYVMMTRAMDDLVTGSKDGDRRTHTSVGSRATTTEAFTNGGPGVQTVNDHTTATLPPTTRGWGLGMSKGGEAIILWPRSSSMLWGTSQSSSNSYKKRIWSKRNSRIDSSSTDNGIASFTALTRETTLMAMWSWISSAERPSTVEGSG